MSRPPSQAVIEAVERAERDHYTRWFMSGRFECVCGAPMTNGTGPKSVPDLSPPQHKNTRRRTPSGVPSIPLLTFLALTPAALGTVTTPSRTCVGPARTGPLRECRAAPPSWLPDPTADYPGDAGVLDTMVEHGDHYAGRPELHIGFRHQGDDE